MLLLKKKDVTIMASNSESFRNYFSESLKAYFLVE